MTVAVSKSKNLEEFLKRLDIEESPAWEFIDGEISQKPMPGGKHSRLQLRLANAINTAGNNYEEFPELRCTFGGRSLVPDLAIIASHRIPVDETGEIISTGIDFAPDWIIEILSPNQSQMRVTRKILHSLRHGCKIGWLVDPNEKVVLAYSQDSLPDELTGEMLLPCLEGINLELMVEQMFAWLKVAGNH